MPPLSAYAFAVVALTLTGCTHDRLLDTASPESRSHVNVRAEEEAALLTLHDGEEIRTRGLHVAPDVTTWIDPDSNDMRSVPTSALASVRFTDRGRGTLEGLGLGTAIGVAFGAAAGAYILASASDGGFALFTKTEGALLSVAGFGVVGLAIGAVAGVDRGSYTIYAPAPAQRDQASSAGGRRSPSP